MNKTFKVESYNTANYSNKFKKYLENEFKIDYLLPNFVDKEHETVFDGWVGKDMGSYYRFTNDEHTLEFYGKTYIIKNNKTNEQYEMPLPLTISQFIFDAERFNINLYWSEWVDNNFEPKDYLSKDQIIEYFKLLLSQMDRSYELLQ